jgi:Fe2+ transport system protein FeoA
VRGSDTIGKEGVVADQYEQADSEAIVPDCEMCTLDCARKGDRFEVVSVDNADARVQALRFGVCEGASVECVSKIPAGPLVIKRGRQEIAVGRSLAKRISVRRLP